MRSINDRFWADGWIRRLNPLDRYLFLYLLTNDKTTWCGVYELHLGMMAYETGLDERDLTSAFLPRLAPKAIYVDGWVYIPNWLKYHMSASGTLSPQQKKGIEATWNTVPEKIRLKIKEIEQNIDTPPIPYTYPIGGVSPSSLSLSSSLLGDKESPPKESIPEDGEKPKKTERRTKDKEAVYKLFSSKEQPWWRHKQQKIAALALFDLVGVDAVQHGLEIMRENSTDHYCPQAATPFEYEDKREALKRYIKRNGL